MEILSEKMWFYISLEGKERRAMAGDAREIIPGFVQHRNKA